MGYEITGWATAQGSTSKLREGERLYDRFHGFPARSLRRLRCRRKMPDVLVDLGDLHAIVYRSDRGTPGRPRTYVHALESPPKLACDVSGRQLYILGGRYRVTARGIEG